MRIKEARHCDNGDFDLLVSFSKEDMIELGFKTEWFFEDRYMKHVLLTIINYIKEDYDEIKRRLK